MILAKRVLIVDDDKNILRFFTQILQKNGYIVDSAETGRKALEKIHRQVYHAALIDIVLPDANGLDLLKDIPFQTQKIVMTGSNLEENRKKALIEGANAFLIKPIRIEKILETIN